MCRRERSGGWRAAAGPVAGWCAARFAIPELYRYLVCSRGRPGSPRGPGGRDTGLNNTCKGATCGQGKRSSAHASLRTARTDRLKARRLRFLWRLLALAAGASATCSLTWLIGGRPGRVMAFEKRLLRVSGQESTCRRLGTGKERFGPLMLLRSGGDRCHPICMHTGAEAHSSEVEMAVAAANVPSHLRPLSATLWE